MRKRGFVHYGHPYKWGRVDNMHIRRIWRCVTLGCDLEDKLVWIKETDGEIHDGLLTAPYCAACHRLMYYMHTEVDRSKVRTG